MRYKKYIFSVLLTVWCFMIPSLVQGETEQITIFGDHGQLAAVVQTPDNRETYPMVILMHGFSANKDYKLLELIANDLEKEGIASIRFDFNGHGDSEGRFQDMTVLNEIEDAKQVYAYVKQLPNVTNISLIGHSQGGVVASMLAGELSQKEGSTAIQSLVLLAPASNIKDGVLGSGTFGIQFNVETMPEYIELPSGLRVGRNYFKAAYNLPIYETAKQYTGPVKIIHGTQDEMVPTRYGKQFANIYNNVELEILEGYDHEFTQNMPAVADKVTKFIVNSHVAKENNVVTNNQLISWWEILKQWVYDLIITGI
ncbi:alpha/beta hydrolase [Veillonella criceti]|uniref:Acetoin dehydrogenase E2 subunit dihydrolipoyllysine-residue acetyltransferase n=1 Tax=Veillonella criceti TaxID=103891 RepID=A0A380NMF6_9FIRM|nr:alpha/beta fold hydrolase [Veillonella criceti]SUP43317.1 acetoin dehydrogenase E2 subunit dihydrolipoyllysine-residue acetyltransferase [Veillonella criceti]